MTGKGHDKIGLWMKIIGVFCILYYVVCVIGHGFRISVLWIWLVLGIGIAGGGIHRDFRREHGFRRRRSSRLAAVIRVLAVAFFIYVMVFEVLVGIGTRSKGKPDLDYLIVLGAGVYGTTPSPALQSRVDTAAKYLLSNADTKVIVSGGQGAGEDISEAACMKGLLMEQGIEENKILLEDQSTTTVENLRYSCGMIPDRTASIGLVTSNFHVFRAVVTARSMGNPKVSGIAAPFSGTLLPHYMLRECMAFTVELLRGNISGS